MLDIIQVAIEITYAIITFIVTNILEVFMIGTFGLFSIINYGSVDSKYALIVSSIFAISVTILTFTFIKDKKTKKRKTGSRKKASKNTNTYKEKNTTKNKANTQKPKTGKTKNKVNVKKTKGGATKINVKKEIPTPGIKKRKTKI